MKTLLYKAGLFIICIICYANVHAQSDSLEIDSLKKVLLTEKEDTNKVNTFNRLSSLLLKNKNAASLPLQRKALALATKLNFDEGIGEAYWLLGDSYYVQLNNAEALKNYYEALKHYEKSGNKSSVANILVSISNINSNDEQSLKYAFSALKISKEINDSELTGYVLGFISSLYLNQKRYKIAETYLNTSAKLFHEIGEEKQPMRVLANHESFGVLYNEEGHEALSTGNILAAQNLFTQSKQNFEAALKIADNIKSKFAISEICINLGKLYVGIKDYAKAKNILIRGLLLSKEFGNPDFLPDGYEALASADSALGNYKEAYKNYKISVQYQDSLVNINMRTKAVQTTLQYNFDKKEAVAKAQQDKKDADAKRIKNQQYFAIAALGIVVLAVIIIALIQFRNNRQKQKANNLITQQKQQVETTLSELKSTQAQLIQSEKMASLGELTAGIAHEIQNPLNFVNNFSEVSNELISEMVDEVDKGNTEEVKLIAADIKQNLEKINHHGKRADAIVKGMLQHSRQTKGVKEPTDINALCDEYLRLSYHGLRAKDKNFNADFKTDFDDSIGKINIVPQDIGRVLLNLFNNAFYAVNEKKKLMANSYQPMAEFKTRRINDKIEIIVSDNGNGIPQNIIDKIFQPFFTTKPTGQGTGLGLSLAYDIITKEHNGTIKVESKEGEGSVFIIQLPIV